MDDQDEDSIRGGTPETGSSDEGMRSWRSDRPHSAVVNVPIISDQVTAINAALASISAPAREMQKFIQDQGALGAFRVAQQQASLLQFRTLDNVSPTIIKALELSVTASMADLVKPNFAVSAWRQNLLFEFRSQVLAATSPLRFEPIAASLLADLNRYSSSAARLSEHLARMSVSGSDLLVPQHQAAHRLRKYLDSLDEGEGARGLMLGVRATQSVASLTGTEISFASLASDGETSDAEVVEGEVVAPWLSGPASVRAGLMEALAGIDPGVPELLDGAWDDVQRAGPAAIVKIATCAVEALERTLRALAPEADVVSWLKETDRYRPTHSDRVRYIFRDHKSERKLVVVQVEAVALIVPQLRSRLQAGKHASIGGLSVMRTHLVNVEAILTQVVLGRPS